MKKIIIVLFVVLVSGCNLAGNFYPLEYPIDIDTIEEALQYVSKITYKAEPKGEDHWQYESETIELGTGDCEDSGGVLAHLLIYNVGLSDVKLIYCRVKKTEDYHLLVKAGGIYYEAVGVARIENSYPDKYTTILEFGYSTYLERCRISHI